MTSLGIDDTFIAGVIVTMGTGAFIITLMLAAEVVIYKWWR